MSNHLSSDVFDGALVGGRIAPRSNSEAARQQARFRDSSRHDQNRPQPVDVADQEERRERPAPVRNNPTGEQSDSSSDSQLSIELRPIPDDPDNYEH